jgi:Arc/MetJ-type ribon-helix-helix transcriptional regulator
MSERRSVKLDEEVATMADQYVDKAVDELGIRKFRSRADLVDAAVREYLKKLKAEAA